MISDAGWTAFAILIKATQYFYTHPFEVTYTKTTKQIKFSVTKSKPQLICCGILSLYLFIDSCIYESIALCFYYKSETYAEFIKNYIHLITRGGGSVLNFIFILNRESFAELWSTLSAVFVKEIQDQQNTFSSPVYRKFIANIKRAFVPFIFIQSAINTIAYLNDIPTITIWHSMVIPPDKYPFTVPFFAVLIYWGTLSNYTYTGFAGYTFVFSFNTVNLWVKKLFRNLSKATSGNQISVQNNIIPLRNSKTPQQDEGIRNIKVNTNLWNLVVSKIRHFRFWGKPRQPLTSQHVSQQELAAKETFLAYRSIQILAKQCNNSVNLLWAIGNAFLLICIVFTNCGSIVLFRHPNEKLQFMLVLFGTFLLHLFVAWSYPAAGKIYESSTEFHKLCLTYYEGKINRKSLNFKYLKTCRPVGFWVGSLYCQSLLTTLLFLHTTFNNTVTVLLMKL